MDRESIAEMFSAFGPVNVKRVFSGFGVYADDVCFGLFLRGEFYFKTDETTIPRFEAEDCRPFSYVQPTSGKVVTVNSFWRLPERLYDDQDELADWARAALAVARRFKVAKQSKRTSSRKTRADDVKRVQPREKTTKVVRNTAGQANAKAKRLSKVAKDPDRKR